MPSLWRSIITLAAGAFAILLGLLMAFVTGLPHPNARLMLGIVSILMGLGLIALYVKERYGSSGDPDTVDPTRVPRVGGDSPIFAHSDEIPKAVADFSVTADNKFRIAGQEITPLKIEAFGKLLAESRRYRGRIFERITPAGRQIRQAISTSLVLNFLPEDNKECIFYPVVTVRKGELQDNFRVELEGGAPVLVLTYEEYCQLMVVATRTLLKSAEVSIARRDEVKKTVDEALLLICRRQLASDNYSGADGVATDIATRLEKLAYAVESDYLAQALPGVHESDQSTIDSVKREASIRRNALRQIAKYVLSFYDRYPVVVVLPSEATGNNRAVVKYHRSLTPEWCHRRFSEHPGAFLRERVSAFFSVGVADVAVDIRRASRAQSYHVQVSGPDSSYISRHRLSGLDNYAMVGHEESPKHVRFGRIRGQSYTHWYFRDLARKPSSDDELALHVEFAETPPTSMAKAALSAFACTVLIYVVALISSASESGTSGLQSDFPALMLAFPALAAGWVGLDRGSNTLLVSEIGSRFSSLCTLLLSVSASALFMAQNAGLAQLPNPVLTFLGVSDVFWLTLTLTAMANLLVTSTAWIGRSRKYFAVLGGATVSGTEGIPSVASYASENLRDD